MSDGWQTAPKEPTHEMRVAGRDAWRQIEYDARMDGMAIMRTDAVAAIYKAMLAFAPPPPVEPAP